MLKTTVLSGGKNVKKKSGIFYSFYSSGCQQGFKQVFNRKICGNVDK